MFIVGWVKTKLNEWKRNKLLYAAAENGHLEIVKELIANGGNVNYDSDSCETPLSISSKNGHLEIVKELINAGANVNSWNHFMDSNSPLTWALGKNHWEIVKELIVAGANHNHKNNVGDSTLNIADKKYKKEVVDNLINLFLKQKDKIKKTDFTSLEEFLNTSPKDVLEMGGMHSKYYNNPKYKKQYQEKWLKNTAENNICETAVKTALTLSLEETSSQLSKTPLPYNQTVYTSANVLVKANFVSNDETTLIQLSTSPQMPAVVDSFDISKKQTINIEEDLLKNLPEVPTSELGNKRKENTKSREAIQLAVY